MLSLSLFAEYLYFRFTCFFGKAFSGLAESVNA